MPTTVIEFVVSTTTVAAPIVTATECAARQTTNVCEFAMLPSPQNWPLLAWCHVMVATFVLLCSFRNTWFSRVIIGNEVVTTRFERLRNWMVSSGWRNRANEQQKVDDKNVNKSRRQHGRIFTKSNQYRIAQRLCQVIRANYTGIMVQASFWRRW